MGGDLRTLWRAIRRPMLSWWRKVGIWLLAAIVAFYAAETLTWLGTLGAVSIGTLGGFSWAAPAAIVDTVTMLWAATVCSRLLTQVYEQHAAPEPPGFLRARFLLCYFNALVPLALCFVCELISSGVFRWILALNQYSSSYWQTNHSLASVADAATDQLAPLLLGVISVAWLICLLALVPRRPYLAWILPLAGWAGYLPVYLVQALSPSPSWLNYPYVDFHSSWGWLLGGALLLLMFYALRTGFDRLMQALYGILVAVSFFGSLLHYLIQCGVGQPVLAWLRLIANISRFRGDSPFGWDAFAQAADELYPTTETLLGQLAHLLPLIVEPLWALGMIALIYYVVLAPWWGMKRQQAVGVSGKP